MATESVAAPVSHRSLLGRHGQGPEEGRDRLRLEHRHRRRLDGAGVLARGDARASSSPSRASACTRPAVLLVAFIPMLLVASPTNTSTAPTPTRARRSRGRRARSGPMTGWMNGWAIFLADVIVMASLSDIAAIYTFKLFGFTELGELESRDHHRGGPVDRADDLDLLSRHRALGAHPAGAARRRGRSSSGCSRSSRSSRSTAATRRAALDQAVAVAGSTRSR